LEGANFTLYPGDAIQFIGSAADINDGLGFRLTVRATGPDAVMPETAIECTSVNFSWIYSPNKTGNYTFFFKVEDNATHTTVFFNLTLTAYILPPSSLANLSARESSITVFSSTVNIEFHINNTSPDVSSYRLLVKSMSNWTVNVADDGIILAVSPQETRKVRATVSVPSTIAPGSADIIRAVLYYSNTDIEIRNVSVQIIKGENEQAGGNESPGMLRTILILLIIGILIFIVILVLAASKGKAFVEKRKGIKERAMEYRKGREYGDVEVVSAYGEKVKDMGYDADRERRKEYK
ncbi:MAG: hypothetical protein QW728_04145, partial [Thermoplasmata archaeon]